MDLPAKFKIVTYKFLRKLSVVLVDKRFDLKSQNCINHKETSTFRKVSFYESKDQTFMKKCVKYMTSVK